MAGRAARTRAEPASAPSVPALSAPTLVGRDKELSALADAFSAAPTLVLVEGEAGIGKTRLVQEFLASTDLPSHGVLTAACPPFREPLTLGPVVDAIRAGTGSVRGLNLSGLAGALRPVFPEWAADLPPAPEPAEDVTAARHRLFRALVELLATLDVSVLLVEDAHWADQATLEFLLFLVTRVSPPLSLLVTYRPEDVPDGSLLLRLSSRLPAGTSQARIRVGPLSVDGTADLVTSMLDGEPLSAEFASFLHEHTDGVPLAVEETVRLMQDRADLARRGGTWVRRHLHDIGVPPPIRDAVLERVGRLGPDAQAVLRAAAVLAEPSDEALLGQVGRLPADRVGAALAAAAGSGLLHDNERGLVSFRHVLAARAVHEAIPGAQRRALHARAGRALQSRSRQPAARLAGHFRAAGDLDGWLRYAERAADLALAAADESAAIALLYDLLLRDDLPVDTLVRLMDRVPVDSLDAHRYPGLVAALRTAAGADSITPEQEAEVRFHLGRVLFAMEEHVASLVELERAAPHLGHVPDLATRAMLLLGWPFGAERAATVHREWLDRAAAVAGALEPADRMRYVVDRATALLLLGDERGWSEAEGIPDDTSSARLRLHVVRGHQNISYLAMRWGHYVEARRRVRCALDIADTYDYPRFRLGAQVIEAHLDWFTGAWDGLAARASSLAEDHDLQPVTRLEAVLVDGLLAEATGTRAEAVDRLGAVADGALRRGAIDIGLESAAALARIHLGTGETAEALRATAEPMRLLADKGIWWWATEIVPARVEALVAAGHLDIAAELVTTFARGLRGNRAPAPRVTLTVCRAVLAEGRGEYPRAAALYARAGQSWQALPQPHDALLAGERRARCLLAAGRPDTAVALWTDIHQGLVALGATADAGRVAATLRQHGAPIRPARGGRPSYGDQLSPRELDVVRLLVGGRTNRQIAEALVVSTQTVASHLHSAMRKLRVPSRTALAVTAVERGLVPAGEVNSIN